MKFQPGNDMHKNRVPRQTKRDAKYNKPIFGSRDKKRPYLRPRCNIVLDEDMLTELDHYAQTNNRCISAEIRACIRLALQVRSKSNQERLRDDSQVRTLRVARG